MTVDKSGRNSPVNFDLRQIEIFCKVVELKSFSKAAEAVCLAQPSVSERIATLEKMIGIKLLDRLGREIIPTKGGVFFYEHAKAMLEMKRTVCIAVEDFLGLKQGEIRIGGSTIPGEYILPKYIKKFRKKYPLVSVKLFIADTKEIEDAVLSGDIEIGIAGSKGLQKNLLYRELWNDELVLAVPAKHHLAEKKEVSVKELYNESFILREAGSGTLKEMERYFKTFGSKTVRSLKIAAQLGSSTAVKEGIKAGLGISVLSLSAIETEIEAGILKAVKIEEVSMSRNFYLITDRRRTNSPLCEAMLNFFIF